MVLLAPKRHLTEVVDDFTMDEYLEIQSRIHRLGRAISAAFESERIYVFSFGSREGVAHVHSRIAASPALRVRNPPLVR